MYVYNVKKQREAMSSGQLIYAAKSVKDGIVIDKTFGVQRLLATIKFDGKFYGCIFDQNVDKFFLERIKSMIIPNPYVPENFEKIEDDEEWKTVYNIFVNKELLA